MHSLAMYATLNEQFNEFSANSHVDRYMYALVGQQVQSPPKLPVYMHLRLESNFDMSGGG